MNCEIGKIEATMEEDITLFEKISQKVVTRMDKELLKNGSDRKFLLNMLLDAVTAIESGLRIVRKIKIDKLGKPAESGCDTWAEKEVALAVKRERDGSGTTADEWDYMSACYESALKAYKSLMMDGHSGWSIQRTATALNRLIDSLPLTPIEDTDDVWSDVVDMDSKPGSVIYQCSRYSSLFKTVAEDGSITYCDIGAAYGVSVDVPDVSYTCGIITDVYNELWPVTMPYMPCGKTKIFCDDFLFDEKNDDYDTVAVLYAVRPDGKKVKINRFLAETDDGFVAITEDEYDERRAAAVMREFKRESNDAQ
ncbi:MAG: hypothetical protein RR559_00045 [Bacteroides sp.]